MPTFDLGFSPSRFRSKRPGCDGTSIQDLFAAFPDDQACLDHVFMQRFGPDPKCPRCGGTGRWRRHATKKHYFHPCGGILSPMSGVVFSRSRIGLQLWFYAMLYFCNSPEGIAAPFLARQLGISGPTAFRMSQRIRLHMAMLDQDYQLGGVGKVVNIRIFKILRIINDRRNLQNSAMALLLSDGLRVNSTVIVRPRQKNVMQVISNKVDQASDLITDCYWTFRVLKNYSSGRTTVQFLPEYFHTHPASENLLHGFMQYFNLSFADQFRGVSLENAWLYLKEYEFRYNRRSHSRDTLQDLISRFPTFNQHSLKLTKAAHFVNASAEQKTA